MHSRRHCARSPPGKGCVKESHTPYMRIDNFADEKENNDENTLH